MLDTEASPLNLATWPNNPNRRARAMLTIRGGHCNIRDEVSLDLEDSALTSRTECLLRHPKIWDRGSSPALDWGVTDPLNTPFLISVDMPNLIAVGQTVRAKCEDPGLDWPLCHCAVAQAPLRRTQAPPGPFEIF